MATRYHASRAKRAGSRWPMLARGIARFWRDWLFGGDFLYGGAGLTPLRDSLAYYTFLTYCQAAANASRGEVPTARDEATARRSDTRTLRITRSPNDARIRLLNPSVASPSVALGHAGRLRAGAGTPGPSASSPLAMHARARILADTVDGSCPLGRPRWSPVAVRGETLFSHNSQSVCSCRHPTSSWSPAPRCSRRPRSGSTGITTDRLRRGPACRAGVLQRLARRPLRTATPPSPALRHRPPGPLPGLRGLASRARRHPRRRRDHRRRQRLRGRAARRRLGLGRRALVLRRRVRRPAVQRGRRPGHGGRPASGSGSGRW
jgi:hypothetical protein